MSDWNKLQQQQIARYAKMAARKGRQFEPPRHRTRPQQPVPAREEPQKQFEKFSATELYCPKCKRAQKVREHLLLLLPDGEMYDFRCAVCATSVGTRKT